MRRRPTSPACSIWSRRGEEIVIAKSGKPVARLVRARRSRPRRSFGYDRGKFDVPDDFNAPLPDHLLAAFEK